MLSKMILEVDKSLFNCVHHEATKTCENTTKHISRPLYILLILPFLPILPYGTIVLLVTQTLLAHIEVIIPWPLRFIPNCTHLLNCILVSSINRTHLIRVKLVTIERIIHFNLNGWFSRKCFRCIFTHYCINIDLNQ